MSLRDRVADYFRARPNTWIDGMELAKVGGCYASRTRIAECRTQLGMTIANRVIRRADGQARSEYKFEPPMGQARLSL